MNPNKINNKVWKHFQRLEQKLGTYYYYAHCNFCDEDGSSSLEGRVRTLKNNLKGCQSFIKHQKKEKACSATSGNDACSKSITPWKRSCSSYSNQKILSCFFDSDSLFDVLK